MWTPAARMQPAGVLQLLYIDPLSARHGAHGPYDHVHHRPAELAFELAISEIVRAEGYRGVERRRGHLVSTTHGREAFHLSVRAMSGQAKR